MSNISWCGYTSLTLTIHPLKDILGASSFCLLQINQLQKYMHRFNVNINIHFYGIKIQECNCWIAIAMMATCRFYKKLLCCFPKWLHHFTFLPSIWRWSSFSTISLAFGIAIIFYFSHWGRFVVKACCDLNFYFPNVQLYWTSFFFPPDYPLTEIFPCLLPVF